MEIMNGKYTKDRHEFTKEVKAEWKNKGYNVRPNYNSPTNFKFECERAGTKSRGSKPNYQNKTGKNRKSKQSQGFYCDCPWVIKVKYDEVQGFCALPPTGEHNHETALDFPRRQFNEIQELIKNSKTDEERGLIEKGLDEFINKWKSSSNPQQDDEADEADMPVDEEEKEGKKEEDEEEKEEKEEEEEAEEKRESEEKKKDKGKGVVTGSKRSVTEIDEDDTPSPKKIKEKLILPPKHVKRGWPLKGLDSEDYLIVTRVNNKFDPLAGLPVEAEAHITDVYGEGNCGFRALALLLKKENGENGYEEVKKELLEKFYELENFYMKDVFEKKKKELWFKPDVIDHILTTDCAWFNGEQCGQVVAEKYKRPFIIIEKLAARVFVPLLCPPGGAKDRSPLFLVFVNDDHYQALDIDLNSPIWPKFYPVLDDKHRRSMEANKTKTGTKEELAVTKYFSDEWKEVFPSCFNS